MIFDQSFRCLLNLINKFPILTNKNFFEDFFNLTLNSLSNQSESSLVNTLKPNLLIVFSQYLEHDILA